MSFSDKKGIIVASGFKLQAPALLDVRESVKNKTERDELVTLNAVTKGLKVYVEDEEKLYIYKGGTGDNAWKDISKSYGIATAEEPGIVKSGGDVSINEEGIISVIDDSHNHIISNIDGLENELNQKVDKEEGKGLSTNDFTTEEKSKLSRIQDGAEVNIQSDWNETDSSSDSYIKNKPIIPTVPVYTIEEVSATSGYLKTYQLKKDSAYIGAKINIPKDMVVSGGSVEVVEEADVPYEGAIIGDKYIDLIIANATSSHIYIPVKDLVDVYKAGTSISVSSSNVISVISDTSLSDTSINPVQNKVIKTALDGKLGISGNASNVTNTFAQASTRENLTTGEKLSISLGKIMKWFSDLKTVAFSGNYNDLTNKPTSLPANGGNSDTVDNVHVDNSSTGNALWTAEKIMSQIENSKSIGYQYTGTVQANEVVDMTIPSITDYKTPNVEVLVFINEVWQKAIHGIDYVYAFTSNTNLKITFFNAGQYKVNYFFIASGSFPNFITSEEQPSVQNTGDYWFEIL